VRVFSHVTFTGKFWFLIPAKMLFWLFDNDLLCQTWWFQHLKKQSLQKMLHQINRKIQ